MRFATLSHSGGRSTSLPSARTQLERVAASSQSPIGPGTILALSAAIGFLGGLLELAVMLVKCRWIDGRLLYVSRHYPWMYPVAGLLVLAGPGILLAIVAVLRRGRISVGVAVGWLSFFVFLGLLFRAPIYTIACLLLAAGLAVQAARFAASKPGLVLLLARQGLAGLVLVVAGLMAAVFGREIVAERQARAHLPQAPGDVRNVVWIVLDTVRADHLSLHGYERATSPNLAQLATEGARFDLAIAAAPWTAASHAAMFTGHPCHDLSVSWQRALDGRFPTIAETLSQSGYQTAGFVANTSYCSYETGLDRGFVHYEDYRVSLRAIWLCSSVVERTFNFVRRRLGGWGPFDDVHAASLYRKTAAVINADFLRWLDHRPDQRRPFFAFLNYYDAHHPYFTPQADDSHFGLRPDSAADLVTLRTWWDADKRQFSAHQLALGKDAYDDCIASLDRQLGRLFDELKQRGLWQSSIILITADHGEHLGEHGLYGHGCSLARQELHVPLLIVAPGLVPAGRMVDAPVSLCELPATVLDLLAIRGKTAFPGQSLARYWGGDAEGNLLTPVLAELDGPPEADPNHGVSPARVGPLRSVWFAGAHYIRDGQGREQLYRTEVDPQEQDDVSGSANSQALIEQLREMLGQLVPSPPR